MTSHDKPCPEILHRHLRACRSPATSVSRLPVNSSSGQDTVTALIVQDELSGDILRTRILSPGGEETFHYLNRVNGADIDLSNDSVHPDSNRSVTASPETAVRDHILSNPDSLRAYGILRMRMDAVLLADKSPVSLLRAVEPVFRELETSAAAGFEDEARAAIRVTAAWFLPDVNLDRMRHDCVELNDYGITTYLPPVVGRGADRRAGHAGNALSLMSMAFYSALHRKQHIPGHVGARILSLRESRMYLRPAMSELMLCAFLSLGRTVEQAVKAQALVNGHYGDAESMFSALHTLMLQSY